MQSNNSKDNLLKNVFAWGEEYPQKGQRIVYEGEIAYVIRVNPLLVCYQGSQNQPKGRFKNIPSGPEDALRHS